MIWLLTGDLHYSAPCCASLLSLPGLAWHGMARIHKANYQVCASCAAHCSRFSPGIVVPLYRNICGALSTVSKNLLTEVCIMSDQENVKGQPTSSASVFHLLLPCRSSLTSSLGSLLGDTIMSALFTDHVAAAQRTDPAGVSDSCDAAAAGHCARDSCESDEATASSACSTDHVHDALAPAAMFRNDNQPGSAVCPPSPDLLAVSLHKPLHATSTSQAPFDASATAMPLEDVHSQCNVPVKAGIGVQISSAASHPASPESTASQLEASYSEPGELAASSAAECTSLTRVDSSPKSSGLTTVPRAVAQAALESADPSSQANSLSNPCSLEQQPALGIDPNSSSAVHTPAEAQEPAAPGALISTTDSSTSISSAASLPQLDAGTAVGCQVTVSETGLDCLAGFSSVKPSSSPRASPAAAISSAGASPADQSKLSQASPAGSCTADPSSPATTAPGATSISAGASPAGCSSPAGSSRSVPASRNDISSISVEPAPDSGSLAGACMAAAITQAGASPASSVSPAGTSPAVADSPEEASPASSVSPAEAPPAVAGSLAVTLPNASSQSGVYTPEACHSQDSLILQIAGCADPQQTQVLDVQQRHPDLTAEALFEGMNHVADDSPLALAVVKHIPATMRSCEHASQTHASSNLAQQKDNSSGDSVTNRQLGAVHAAMLELMDACVVRESLKELIAADAQRFDYSADELLCSMCSSIRPVSCSSR